jgi:CBS domain-containing protein
VPVVEGARFIGIMRIEEVRDTPRDQWASGRVGDMRLTDFPVAAPDWTIRDALATMENADIDLLPVVDETTFVGWVIVAEVLELDDLLDLTGEDEPPRP